MGAAASRFFDAPSRRLELVGVTGTSGKTTTAYMLASIFEAAGAPPGVIGTIGIFVGPRKIYSGLTTPEVARLRVRAGGHGAGRRAARGGGDFLDRSGRGTRRRG